VRGGRHGADGGRLPERGTGEKETFRAGGQPSVGIQPGRFAGGGSPALGCSQHKGGYTSNPHLVVYPSHLFRSGVASLPENAYLSLKNNKLQCTPLAPVSTYKYPWGRLIKTGRKEQRASKEAASTILRQS
jgi:hypothetical protein